MNDIQAAGLPGFSRERQSDSYLNPILLVTAKSIVPVLETQLERLSKSFELFPVKLQDHFHIKFVGKGFVGWTLVEKLACHTELILNTYC